MRWIKGGHIHNPTIDFEWSRSHAQLPIADFIENENKIRIYFSTRDSKNRSRPGFIEVDADNPQKILLIAREPLLNLGRRGTFDDCGVMPSWIVDYKQKKYLYYVGWNVRNTIPYHNSIGLAISEDDGKTFHKFSNGPLWDRNYLDPYFSGTSCVLIDDNKIWRNWYLSCTEWHMIKGKPEPRYHIKYAESNDGISWKRKGIIAIDYKSDDEGGIVKASVIKINGIYEMWYSYRKSIDYRTNKDNSYKIGYAESNDGIKWIRKDDESGIETSNAGWDSEMIAYPHVIIIKDKMYMFYNGNGFGKTGFGYAVLKNQ